MKSPLFLLTFVLLIVAFFGAVAGWQLCKHYGSPAPSVPGIFSTAPTDREMEKQLVAMDIEEMGNRVGLSPRQQSEYLDYLDEAASQYAIPMILAHSVLCIESSYDPSARHPQIIVNHKPTFAIGLGGIVWEYNSAALIKEGIASSKLELTEPRVNMQATAFIIHNDIQDIFAKNPNVTEDRFFDELIKRYYGAYDEGYKARMLTKIKDMASKQWIRRVVKTILQKYKSTVPTQIMKGDTSKSKDLGSLRTHSPRVLKAPVTFHPTQAVHHVDTTQIHVSTVAVTQMQIQPLSFLTIP